MRRAGIRRQWEGAEVVETLSTFESLTGFVGPAEVLMAAGTKPT
jgi:hypothetical protein